jgi:hypothetical protein
VPPSTWNYVNAITTSQQSHLRPLFAVQAKEEHLDKLVKAVWLDQSTPTDDDMATPIREDILMQQIKKSLIILPNDQLQLPCLWKNGHPDLPNNYELCKKRLIALLSSKLITTTTSLLSDYNAIFDKWEESGYIEQIFDPCPHRQGVWYAPHFPVVKMQKETTKIRPVFDCAAKRGVCLNDFLTQGPQVMNELVTVMHHFRRYD